MLILNGRYQILQELGQGGFGTTHLARDIRNTNHSLCVVKELLPRYRTHQKVLQLFQQESKMLKRLGKHPQIPKLLAAFSEVDRWYLIQEYIDGTTLSDELNSQNGQKLRKSESEVVAILYDVLTVLSFVHQENVVHRDVKPENLIRRKNDGKIVLIDFGMVKELTSSQINQQGTIVTTICVNSEGYSPYEQKSLGKAVAASDIFALGVTAIEALTGKFPRELQPESPTAEWTWRQYCQVSDSLAAFLSQMVKINQRQRFRNAGVALTALKEFTGVSSSVQTLKPSPPSPFPKVQQPTTPSPRNLSKPNLPWSTPTVVIPSQRPSKKRKVSVLSPTPPILSSSRSSIKRRVPNPTQLSQSSSVLGGMRRRNVLNLLGLSVAGVLTTLSIQQLLRFVLDDRESETMADEPIVVPTQPDGTVSDSSETVVTDSDSLAQSFQSLDVETVRVNPQGKIVATPKVQVRYFDEPYLIDKLGTALPLRMVQVPEGEFVMGSPEDATYRDEDEGPQHQVKVSTFWIGAFAVTMRQYLSVMNEEPPFFRQNKPNWPLGEISWVDAETFCKKLTELTDNTYRLPSEAEWEYACRAGTTTPFAFGEKLRSDIAHNWDQYGPYQAQPSAEPVAPVDVDSFYPNRFGLYNMHGNVAEWCLDDYRDNYIDAPDDGSPVLSTNEKSEKVLRGGSWHQGTSHCRSAARQKGLSTFRNLYNGFRVVCVLSS